MDDWTEALIAARDGDHRAFERLVRLSRPDVTRLCGYLGNADSVDDLVQETYLRALRGLAGYRNDAPARPWLMTIARRTCADFVRRHIRARAATAEPEDEVVLDSTGAVELGVLLDLLDPDQRQAFVLTQLIGLSYEETATACDCPIGTIRSRVARARTRLASTLQQSRRVG
jgi:RNA polymerase sigma-70 factor, ECF subfamily